MKSKSRAEGNFVGSPKQLTAVLLVVSFLSPSFAVFAQGSSTTPSGSPPPVEHGESFDISGGDSLLDSGEDGNLDVSRYAYNSGRLDDVDKITGAFTFEVPITTPPGRNGIEPKLSLQYYSQPQYETSVIGYGWGLSIPYIARINKQGSERMFGDTYFYSSMSGELASTTSTTYQAKVENGDFMAYEFSSNSWTAKDKQGNVYKFGNNTDTRQDITGNSATTSKWMLEEVRDRNGNYITYEYYKSSRQIYPSKITYTHSSTSADGIFEVDFLRESRGATTTSATVGFTVTTDERIYEIDTKVNGTWARKYVIGYSSPLGRDRVLMTSVVEYGRGDDGATTTRPAYQFNYQESDQKGWSVNNNWNVPEFIADDGGVSLGTLIADINADGKPDILHSLYDEDESPTTTEKSIYLNTGLAPGWATSTTWKYPWAPYFTSNDETEPFFPADLNADGYYDFIYNGTTTADRYVYINNHSGWATSTNWSLPTSFKNSSNVANVRIVDVNGDQLPDILKSDEVGNINLAFLNTGNGWATSTTWVSTQNFVTGATDLGVAFEDVNGDGMVDILRSYLDTVPNPDVTTKAVYLNTGTGWSSVAYWLHPDTTQISQNGKDMGFRFGEINGDGLPDMIQGYGGDEIPETYINNGLGWNNETDDWDFPSAIISTQGTDVGARLLDLDGDGLMDYIISRKGTIGVDRKYVVFNNSKKIDVLTGIKTPQGASTTVEYKSTHDYKNGSTFLNPNLPYPLYTVATTTVSDGLGNTSTTTYSYEGGQLYWDAPYDHKFAGFSIITRTDSDGNVTKTYYHQASTTESSLGEYQDHVSKIGKPYRIEQYDNTGNLYNITINKWDKTDLGNNINFVKLAEKLSLNYDGDSDHKDSLETYSYDDTTGNITQKISWGEVLGSGDGTYSDTGSDKFVTDMQYATSSTYHIYIPSHETVTNQSGSKVRESKFYYDSSSLGSVSKGNLTKQEMWKSSSNYIDVEKTYNGYGLVTAELDPRDKSTSYTYDSYNLYPATTTNPLSQATGRQYDYSSGKVRITFDANSNIFQTIYDGFDRAVEEKQPDLSTPSTLVTKATYTYTDTGFPTKVQKIDYLNSATSSDSYTYFDGLGRKIQDRIEAESNYSVKDYKYNLRGLLRNESLPYFSSGTTYTGTSSPSASYLLLSYTYDPLERVTTIVNAVGTTTNAYDQWTASTTDAEGNIKGLSKDAYGNLISVNEQNGASIYTTGYEYDGNNKLTKITDADGSVRNFTYDGLGRRITAEDLHDVGDGTYGTWSYVYDNAGNMATSTDPKSQQIDYTYDDLNRVLTENYTGTGGTEVTYAYDSCAYGKGKLCSATSTDAATQLSYNALGLTASESKYLNSIYYVTSYAYDRLGNKTDITYPDNAVVKYRYNAAGQLETIPGLVSDFDYGPTGQISYKAFTNCIESTYTYDSTQLYHLTNIQTGLIPICTPSGGGLTANLNSFDNIPLFALKMPRVFAQLDFNPLDILDEATPTPIQTNTTTTETAIPQEVTSEEPTPSVEESPLTPTVTSDTAALDEIVPKTSTSILRLLEGKTSEEKAEIKSARIAEVAPVKEIQKRKDFDIKIESIKTIPGGVELFARVWKNGEQIGFGTDGTVDMERFQIINPPVLIDDPNGPIVRESKDREEIITYNLREDPKEALLQVLEHTLSVMKNIHGPENIMEGKQGKTTSIFYPAAGQNSPVDGNFDHSNASASFATTIAGTGSNVDDTATVLSGPELNSSTVSNQFNEMERTIWGFDTSSIPDTDTISSATLSLVSHLNTSGLGDFDVVIVPTSPASASSLTSNDFQNAFTRTSYGFKGLSTFVDNNSTYNDITFNSTGMAGINKTGNTFLGGMTSWDFNQSFTGTWVSNVESRLRTRYVDETGTAKDPKLVVEHAAGGGSSPSPTTNIQNISYVYDKVGNITAITDNSTTGAGKTLNFSYDDLNRLTFASSTAASSTPYKHSFTFSSIGNITGMATSTQTGTTTYSYAETNYANPHAPTTIGSATLTYDNNGNLTANGPKLYTWDYRNRMTQAGSGTASTTFAYDNTYERVKKVNAGVTTYYANDLYNLTSATTTKNIYAGGQLIATIEGNGGVSTTTGYIHLDHLGGTNVVTDSSGTVVQTLDYYPFGSERIDSGTDVSRRQFIGEEYDEETAMSYLNARYYQNDRGQFTSQDPVFWEIGQTNDGKAVLQNPQAQNSYSYAQNSPLVNKDPTGRIAGVDDLAGFVGGAAIGWGSYLTTSYITSQPITLGGSVGSALTGGIIGWGAINTPATLGTSNAISASLVTGLIGGFYGNLGKQGIDIATGKQKKEVDWAEAQKEGAIYGVTGFVLQGVISNAKIPYLSSGRNSYSAIGESMQTKFTNNTVSTMSGGTAVKSAIGSQASDSYRTIISGLIDTLRSLSKVLNSNNKTK